MIDIVKTLNGALELAQTIEKTIELGTQPEEGCKFLTAICKIDVHSV